MLPTPITTALSAARLDIGHRLGVDRQIPVGAAVLTAELRGAGAHFTLDSRVLQPCNPTDALLAWLDRHLTRHGATISGYRLDDAAALLARLPGAEWSPSIRAMTGCGKQYVLDLSAGIDNDRLTFQQACAQMRIFCAPADPDPRFSAWVRSDVRDIEQDAQIHAIATFRLIIRRLASINPVGRSIAAVISSHLAVWLEQADHPAAQAHVADLLSVAD